MHPCCSGLVLLLALIAVAAAQTSVISIVPSNDTSTISTGSDQLAVALNQTGSSDTINVMTLSNGSTRLCPNMSALSCKAQTAGYVADPLFLATSQNQLEINTGDIALISCDPGDYPGNIQAQDVFSTAVQVQAVAILFYSRTSAWCKLSAPGSNYNPVFSMTSMNDSSSIYSVVQANNNKNIQAAIGFDDNIQGLGSNGSTPLGNNPNGGQNNSSSGGSSPTTAVAMIILYSITGLITALFLIIIITGAVRAHRHPERYGPRNILGRTRQSRAKGLARAILEGLPIVKFGEEQPAKPTDVELADHDHAAPEISGRSADTSSEEAQAKDYAAPRASTSDIGSANHAAPTTAAAAGTTTDDNSLGCSICTDDFEQGQDLRVLPCDHKFHPACIDPWLLNVSGTCPLCRINLNPASADDNDAEPNETDELSPPLNSDAAGQGERNSFRRSLFYGVRGRTTVNSPQVMEQRLNEVRNMRARYEARHSRTAGSEAEEGRRRRRLRDVFGIRTRTRGGEDEVGSAGAAATATPGGSGGPDAVIPPREDD